MFKNYLKIAVRNLLRHKGYSLINIAGLAIGMTCCMLIFLYVQHELSYDRFHEKADRLYRVVHEKNQKGTMNRWAVTPSAYAPHLLQEFLEIRHAVRIAQGFTPLLRYGSNRFMGEQFVFADSSLFDMFSFPLLQGNPRTEMFSSATKFLSRNSCKAHLYFG